MSNNGSRRFVHRLATVGGGLLAGALLAIGAPAGMAAAHLQGNDSADTVGRKSFDNPAPGVRVAQAVGDHIFNDDHPGLNNSPLGDRYRTAFGTPNYEHPGHAENNGTVRGVLNNGSVFNKAYDGLQEAGVGLPSEEQMPGTIVKAIGGHQHGDDDGGHSTGDGDHHSVAQLGCVKATGATIVRASSGSSC